MGAGEGPTEVITFFRRGARFLTTSRGVPWLFALLAVLLALPALQAGWLMDDYHHRAALLPASRAGGLDPAVLPRGTPAGFFCFLDGEPEHLRRAMELGTVPWWTAPDVRACFFRPLAFVTHWLDYRLWPDSAPLMHLQSLFWFGLLVRLVALLYRRILGLTSAAFLAALFFALDDAHGVPAGWIAQRNALLAAVFGVGALLAQDGWQREGWRPGRALAPLLFGLSLLSGESGVATLAYLAAYALFLAPGPLPRRLGTLAPYLVILVLWRGLAASAGFGVRGMDFYLDPGAEPLRFLGVLPERAPVLLLGQWTLVPADVSLFVGPNTYRQLWLAALAVVAALALLFTPLWRREPAARFFAGRMLLSLVPICATFPSNRLLTFVGIGAMGLLGMFLERLALPQSALLGRLWRGIGGLVGVALLLVHGAWSPFRLPREAGMTSLQSPQIYLPREADNRLASQSLQVVNGPFPFFAHEFPFMQAAQGLPVPRQLRVLFPSLAATEVSRPDARTLILRPEDGYLLSALDASFRSRRQALRLGDEVRLPEVTLRVTALTPDRRPAEVVCRYGTALEDRSLRWPCWRDGSYRPFTLPAVGETVRFPVAMPDW